MKKLLAFLMILLLTSAALAEMDLTSLREDPDWYSFTLHGTVDTVYRAVNQPYMGQVEEGFDGDLSVYLDYITLVDADATVLRLMVSTMAWDDPYNAGEIRLTVGKTSYTFAVTHDESEYDGVYMEDYVTCLAGDGLNMIKAIAQQKKDEPICVELLSDGKVVFSGLVIISGEEAAAIYDRYIDMGGKKQNLKGLEEAWPCKVETVK